MPQNQSGNNSASFTPQQREVIIKEYEGGGNVNDLVKKHGLKNAGQIYAWRSAIKKRNPSNATPKQSKQPKVVQQVSNKNRSKRGSSKNDTRQSNTGDTMNGNGATYIERLQNDVTRLKSIIHKLIEEKYGV